jgi:hypothetical protein
MNLCLPGDGVEEKAEGDRFLLGPLSAPPGKGAGCLLPAEGPDLSPTPARRSPRRLNQIIKHARINPHLAAAAALFHTRLIYGHEWPLCRRRTRWACLRSRRARAWIIDSTERGNRRLPSNYSLIDFGMV